MNDLTFEDLQRQVITPWLQGMPFTVAGTLISDKGNIEEIRVSNTEKTQSVYAEEHNARMRAKNIGDAVTDRRYLPLEKGQDYTNELLFSQGVKLVPAPTHDMDKALIVRLCERISQAAHILAQRRKSKLSYQIEDEYDVQDLLQCMLRAYLQYSVQEDPLPKVAGTLSGRADISIEELGMIIEVKFARKADDQRKFVEEFHADLGVYTQWPHLKTLLYVVYNSNLLKDPEALKRLNGEQTVHGKQFETSVILA